MKPVEGSGPASRLATLPPGEPKLTLGWHAWDWCRRLTQPNGPRAGLHFEPTVDQLRFLLWWYAIDREGRWLFNHGARRLAKGSGKSPFAAVLALIEFCAPVRLWKFDPKAPGRCRGKPVDLPLVQIAATAESQPLALDTPVPTPYGYTTIGAIQPGDFVFGSDGRPVQVKDTTPVFVGLDCYRVKFDDGEEIIASADHAWTVARANSHDRKREMVTVTTAQMAKDYLQNGGGARYSMPVVGLEYPASDLPIDPYLLGLWLGDGTTKDASIAFDVAHESDVLRLVAGTIEPYEVITVQHGPGNQGRLRVKRRSRLCRWGHEWSNNERRNGNGHVQCGQCLRDRDKPKIGKPLLTLRERLRELGVLGHKHVPASYLMSSHDQRLALLQGLIDSDGAIDAKGRAMFVNKNMRLVDDVCKLAVSLGFKTTVLGDPTGAKRVFFNPKDGRIVARLPHKVARHVTTTVGSSKERRIRLVESVASVPTKCIAIDTEDHLFIVGWHNTLTHNTANTMRMVRAFAPKGSRLVAEYQMDPGKTRYYKLPEGTLEVITSSATAAEGAEASFVIADETENWKPSNGGVALAATLADNLAKSGSRMLETSNAWVPGAGSVAEATWEAWLAQEEGRTRGEQRILYDARIAPPDTDMSDPESLKRALEWVYGDCDWKRPHRGFRPVPDAAPDVKPIMERIWSPRAMPDDSKRKYLNWPTAAQDAWLSLEEWTRLADTSVLVDPEEPVALFFDGSKSKDATALIGCTLAAGHIFTLGVWEPNPNDENDTVDAGLVDLTVMKAFEDHRVVAFFADVREWEQFALTEWPQRYKDQIKVWAAPQARPPQPIAWDMRGHAYDFAKATEACYEEIQAGAFTHDGHSAVARHMANARRRPYKDAIAIGKESPGSPRKIDAAVCVIGARMVRRIVLGTGKRFGAGGARVVVLR